MPAGSWPEELDWSLESYSVALTEDEGSWAFLHPQETDSLGSDSRRHQDGFRIYPIWGQTIAWQNPEGGGQGLAVRKSWSRNLSRQTGQSGAKDSVSGPWRCLLSLEHSYWVGR